MVSRSGSAKAETAGIANIIGRTNLRIRFIDLYCMELTEEVSMEDGSMEDE